VFLNKIFSILIFQFLWQFSTFAFEFTDWKVENKVYKIYFDSSLSAYFSQDCIKNEKCLSKNLVLKVRAQNLKTLNQSESINPGSPFCTQFNGKVLLARNSNNSEVAFCQLSDKSLVELSGIYSGK